MAQINFGNITNIGGKNVFLGSQSGLNTEALLTALTTAKRLPAVKFEETISKNKSKITALNDLKSKLSDLKTKLDGLRNPTGVGASTKNIFDSRNAFLTMSNGDTASNYIGVITNNGAPVGKYDIKINNLAKADKWESLTFTSKTDSIVQDGAGTDDSMFTEGTFKINGQNVTVSEGDNLIDINAKINSISSTTGVTSSIVKISETSYKLALSHKSTGTDNQIVFTDTAGVVPVDGGFSETQDAENAEIELNGDPTVITRQSNTIDDILENTTFTLYQETGSATLKLDIDKNNETISAGVSDFLVSYNSMREFLAYQTQTDEDGQYLDTAVLYDNSTMRTVLDRMASFVALEADAIINPFSTGTDSAPTRLGNLGVSFTNIPASDDGETTTPEVSNVLDVDFTKLSTNLDKYFDDVRGIFEFKFTANNGDINVLNRNNTVSGTRYTLVVDTGLPDGQKARITHLDGIALTAPAYLDFTDSGSGYYNITGTGDLAGFSTTYSGDGTDTINLNNTNLDKKFTLEVNNALPGNYKAKVTHIFGQELSTAIDMLYAGGSSTTITGQGSFAGLDMLYTGDGTDSIDVTISQGVADKMFNSLEDILNGLGDAEGLIDAEIASLQTANEDLQESVDKIDVQVDDYRQRMLEKYAALEAAISSANQVLALLDAQSAARENS